MCNPFYQIDNRRPCQYPSKGYGIQPQSKWQRHGHFSAFADCCGRQSQQRNHYCHAANGLPAQKNSHAQKSPGHAAGRFCSLYCARIYNPAIHPPSIPPSNPISGLTNPQVPAMQPSAADKAKSAAQLNLWPGPAQTGAAADGCGRSRSAPPPGACIKTASDRAILREDQNHSRWKYLYSRFYKFPARASLFH